jgi:hypothetical protein
MCNFEVSDVGHARSERVCGLDQLQLVVVPKHREDGGGILKK